MAVAGEFEPRHFSTDNFPERVRLAQWREEFGRTIVRVDIEPIDSSRPFKAHAILQELPGVRTAVCWGSLSRFDRTPALAADGDDSVGLIVNTGQTAVVSHRGVDTALRVGDAFLARTSEAGMVTSSGQICIVLPRAPIAFRIDHLDDALMRPLRQENEVLRLLVGYLNLIGTDVALRGPDVRQAVINHVHDLAAMAINTNRDLLERGKHSVAAARLVAVSNYIQTNFTDPALTVASVARRHKISPRYLQQLLEESGVSFVARMNELRLKRALTLLTKFPNRPIADISVQAGFSSVSHFNRLFRQRFGDTPGRMRDSS